MVGAVDLWIIWMVLATGACRLFFCSCAGGEGGVFGRYIGREGGRVMIMMKHDEEGEEKD